MPDPDAPELLPCPWCGPVTSIDFGHEMGGHSVLHFRFCDGCGAQGPNQRTENGAIAAWNTRANPDAQARHTADERIRVLTEVLTDSHYALTNLFALVNGEVPSLLEDHHQYGECNAALDKARAALGGGG